MMSDDNLIIKSHISHILKCNHVCLTFESLKNQEKQAEMCVYSSSGDKHKLLKFHNFQKNAATAKYL